MSNLELKKTIYASRVGKTKERVIAILNLEIETHLRNNPDLKFEKVGEVEVNSDKSKTYPLLFKTKA